MTVLLLLGAACLEAQTAGRISGEILDSSHAAVQGAMVTAENTASGKRRVAATDAGGFYAIPDLPIGLYTVRAEKSGFRTTFRTQVRVGVAAAVTANFVITPGDIHEVVNVAEVPNSDVAPGASLQTREIADLPSDGRDYARFSLLSPGAVPRSGSMADLPFNGLTIVLNSYSIDGVEASRVDLPYLTNAGERGARMLTGSMESIAEFRVQSSNYDAQYGRAASAYINIATRSGTNRLHGAVFQYIRNDFFDARNFFNTRPDPAARFRYTDFGANLGGPVRKNRTFFFANYEGSRQRVGITGSGTTPSPALRSLTLAQSPALAPILAEFPRGLSATSDPRVDMYSTVSVSRVREDTGTVRLDHAFSGRDSGFARLNVNDSHVRGPLFGINPSSLGLLDAQDVPVRTSNAAIQEEHVFGPHLLSESLLGMQRVAAQYNSASPFPVVAVAGLSIAPGGNTNQKTISSSYQFGHSMSFTTGAHEVRWGASAYRLQNDLHTSGASRLLYASLDDFARNIVATASVAPGIPGNSVRAYQVGLYIQETWRVQRSLTLELGLRYDYEPPIFDPAHSARVFDTRTQTLGPPGARYYRGNDLDFAPRVAASWHPGSRWILRAGYGVFYEPYPVGYASFSIPQNTLPGNTTLLRQQIPSLGYPITPFLSQGIVSPQTVTGFDWTRADTYAQQWSAVALRRLTNDLSWQAAWVGNHALNLHRRYNVNLFDPARGQRPNPHFADIIIEATDGQSLYESLQTSVNQRFHNGLLFALHYTWSHAIDDAGDDNVGSSMPQDVTNLGADRGNGAGDARHTGSFDAVYELPLGRGKRFFSQAHGFPAALLSGWRLSGVGMVRSGVATSVTIPISQTGNGATANQRPNYVPGSSQYAAHPSVGAWLNPAAFTLPPTGSFGNLGRNTVYGPRLVQIDASAIKSTPLSDSATLEFRLEAFNLPNHPNFAEPNTMLGGVVFGRILNTLGRTLGLGTARQIQLALRLRF